MKALCIEAGRKEAEETVSMMKRGRWPSYSEACYTFVTDAPVHDLEQYDVEDTIRVVRELGTRLVEASMRAKHRFSEKWVEQLVQRYRGRPGKPVVHLNDLIGSVMPVLGPVARRLLAGVQRRFTATPMSISERQRFQNISKFVSGESGNPAKLRTWRGYADLTGLDINALEPHVVRLSISNGRVTRKVDAPRLPFRLATVAGAKVLGYWFDSDYKTAAFTNADPSSIMTSGMLCRIFSAG
jgi:hypothetical protein